MANLSWSVLKKEEERVKLFIEKIDNYGTSKDGRKFQLAGKKVYKELTINNKNPDAVEWYKKVKKDKIYAPAAPTKKYLIDKELNGYVLSNLEKTQEFGGGGFNYGHVGEGVFAAAIAARFIKKSKSITVIDVMAIIQKLPNAKQGTGSSVTTKLTIDSPNAEPLIVDKVNITIQLARKDMTSLRSTNPKFLKIIPAAVTYVNKFEVREWADYLYHNNVVNTIDVKSLGISGSNETKVDTFVEIDGERVGINVSLKTKDIGQFGSQSGVLYKQNPNLKGPAGKRKGQVEFWKTFGIDIHDDNTEKAFFKHTGAEEYEEAFQLIFKKVNKMGISNENLAKGISYHATLEENNMEVVDLSFNKLTVYRYDDIITKFEGIQIKPELTISSDLPTLRFRDESARVIIQIRARRSLKTFKTVVEQGSGLKDIIGEQIKLDRAV